MVASAVIGSDLEICRNVFTQLDVQSESGTQEGIDRPREVTVNESWVSDYRPGVRTATEHEVDVCVAPLDTSRVRPLIELLYSVIGRKRSYRGCLRLSGVPITLEPYVI